MMVGVNGTGKTTTTGKLAALFSSQGKHRPPLRRRHLPRRRHRAARSLGRALERPHHQDQTRRRPLSRALRRLRRRQGPRHAGPHRRYRRPPPHQDRPDEGARQDAPDSRKAGARRAPPDPPRHGRNHRPEWADQQARLFTEAARVTGIVLTKLDGTAKGGIVLAIATELKLPVVYAGIGEKMEDILPFDSDSFVDSLLE